MIRAVVDPSVLVSAFLGRPDAGPGRLITAWRDQRLTVAGFAARSEHRPDPAVAEPTVRDPDDDYLVALAREEQVDVLVSLDRDLLDSGLEDPGVEDPATFVARLT